MSRSCLCCLAVLLLNIICLTSATATGTEAELRRVEVPQSPLCNEVTCDIGDLIAAGRVQPREAIGTETGHRSGWLLRNPQSASALRWPRTLLNAGPEAPDLVIDPQLQGTYDVHAIVRAVDGGRTAGPKAASAEPLPMAFELALDDGSPARDCRRQRLSGSALRYRGTGRLRLHGRPQAGRAELGKPVYLYGFRFVPCAPADSPATGKALRWLATDHVTIVQEPDKHFAFPGVALLPRRESESGRTAFPGRHDGPEGPSCVRHLSAGATIAGGDLVVVYREGTVHAAEPGGKVSLSRSTDGGRTWQPRVTALDRPDVDDRDPSIFPMKDGTLLLFSSDCVCTSRDGGRSWSPPQPTPVFGPKGGVEDEQGHIVYGGLKRQVQADFARIQGTSAVLQADAVYRSRDHGVSWEPAGIATYTLYIPGRSDYVWYDEPFLCVVPNRFWIFTARVDLDGLARIIRSPDAGRTWEPVLTTPVWGYPQHLLPCATAGC